MAMPGNCDKDWGGLLLSLVIAVAAGHKLVCAACETWRCLWEHLSELEETQQDILQKWEASDAALKDLLLANRNAVLVEHPSFLNGVLSERWVQHKTEVMQQIRLLGLEVQDLREQIAVLLKTQALLRRYLLHLQSDVPQQLRDIANNGMMLREYLECDVQALGGALTGLEERLNHFRQESREGPSREVLNEISQLRRDLRTFVGAQVPMDPNNPPPPCNIVVCLMYMLPAYTPSPCLKECTSCTVFVALSNCLDQDCNILTERLNCNLVKSVWAY